MYIYHIPNFIDLAYVIPSLEFFEVHKINKYKSCPLLTTPRKFSGDFVIRYISIRSVFLGFVYALIFLLYEFIPLKGDIVENSASGAHLNSNSKISFSHFRFYDTKNVFFSLFCASFSSFVFVRFRNSARL